MITFPLRRRNQHVLRASVDGFDSTGMIRVKMCQHHGFDPINAEAAQAGLDQIRMSAGVNKDVAGLPLRVESAHDQGITLSHIAHGDSPVGGTRYRKPNDLGEGEREGHAEGECCSDRAYGARPARTRHNDEADENARGSGAGGSTDAIEPGQAGEWHARCCLGHQGNPRGRNPTQPRNDVREPRHDGREHEGHHAQNGCHRRGRLGEHVCQHPVRWPHGREKHDDRLTHKLR